MKKPIYILTILLAFIPSIYAQEKGDFWTGGNLFFNYQDRERNYEYTSFGINPEIGFQLSDHWGIGLKVGYSFQKYDYGLNGDDKTNKISATPFARYFIWKKDRFSIFLDGGVGYSYSIRDNNDLKTHSIDASITPGVMYKLTNRLGIKAGFGSLRYSYEKAENMHHIDNEYHKKKDTNKYFNANFNMDDLYFGVNLFF